MKTLAIYRAEGSDRATVTCDDGEVSTHVRCAYCIHCRGIRVGARVFPPPQEQASKNITKGVSSDEELMNAQMMFNTLMTTASGIDCDDDRGEGFRSRHWSREQAKR